jgi:antitoxin (DNA-binding transcriptional repressor) of toxin-antitoxin stability system
MRTVAISVTEAARNFADCINRVRYQGTSFILHKNGIAVARIVPDNRAADEQEPASTTAEETARSGSGESAHDFEPGRRAPLPEIW